MLRTIDIPLKSDSYTLSKAENRLGMLIASDPMESIVNLRQQFAEQGYLWLKGLLNRERVLAFRQRYFEALSHTGLLKEGSSAVDGLYSFGNVNQQKIRRAQSELVRSSAYESFCLSDKIWQFYERLMGDTVYLHKRKLVRHIPPQTTIATGAHYDLVYLRGGTDSVCSSWIPLGDIPVEMGGLVYLENSHHIGREMETEFSRKATDLPRDEQISAYNKYMDKSGWLTKDLPSLAERTDSRWLMADYEAGDMVIHGAYTIHASTNNIDTQGRIRLSTDIRYQRLREEIDMRWNNHWSLDDML
jgi:ectoine hydroxylase-related dioxygenase (phytanoyl-CoA dioxygenase family)